MAEDIHFQVAKYEYTDTFTLEPTSLLNISGIFHAQIFFSHIWQWNCTRTSNPVIMCTDNVRLTDKSAGIDDQKVYLELRSESAL